MNCILLAAGDLGFAGLVIVTGLTVVFAALVFLVLIFKIFGNIMSGVARRKMDKNRAKINRTAVRRNNARNASATAKKPLPEAPPPHIESGISNEIIAVISAAVAAFDGGKIKSVKKSSKKNTGRSAWANAGIFDNTKPF